LITSDILLEGRTFNEIGGARMSIPRPEIGLAYYLVKKVEKNEFTPEHSRLLSTLLAQCQPERVSTVLADLFGERSRHTLQLAVRHRDWNAVGASLDDLRTDLHERRPLSRDSILFELKRILQRLFVQTGFQVVVFGPDGSGKSTVIDALRKELTSAFWGTEYYHLRPRIGTGVVHGSSAPVENPHAQKPRNPLSSVLKLGYYGADYIIGYWSAVKPLLLRSRLVIFDRYYHDILVDPIRYRYSGPVWAARLLGRFIPKPDLYMFLDAPADVIQRRKAEVSAEETERQTSEYRALAASLRPSVVIDASAPVETVTSAAVDSLLDRLAERLEKRFWLR
jgi:thymidylate kinase